METATKEVALSPEERAKCAERRHLFWRSRCIEHAAKIDKLTKQLYALQRRPIEAHRINELRADVEELGISKPWLDLVKFARAIEAEHGIT